MNFLHRMPVAEEAKSEANKWALKKLKTYTEKEKFKQMKRNPKEWEKVFTRYTSDRGFMSGMDKEVKEI